MGPIGPLGQPGVGVKGDKGDTGPQGPVGKLQGEACAAPVKCASLWVNQLVQHVICKLLLFCTHSMLVARQVLFHRITSI